MSLSKYVAWIKAIKAHPYYRSTRTTLILIAYFISGSLFYHIYEGWDFGVSFAFTIVTISTVGYGYHSPSDDKSRLFTIFYMIFGVYFVYASIGDLLVNNLDSVKNYFENKKGEKIVVGISYYRKRLYANIFLILVTLFLGAVCFVALEGWTFIEAFYFAVETSTTVGYGDLELTNTQTRCFIPFYIIISTILVAYAIQGFREMKDGMRQLKNYEKMQRLNQDLAFIAELDKGNGVSKSEFVLAILQHNGKLDYDKDVAPWIEKFEKIDVNGDGTLVEEELRTFSETEANRAKEELERIQSRQNTLSSVSYFNYALSFGEVFRPSQPNNDENKTKVNELKTKLIPQGEGESDFNRNSIRTSIVKNNDKNDESENEMKV